MKPKHPSRSAVPALLALCALLATAPASAQAPASAPASALAPAPKAIVIGQSYALVSHATGVTHAINVYTPAGYNEGAGRYPVVYLLDGGTDQDFHHITGLAQLGGFPWGPLQGLIVVGIESRDRRNEFTPPTADPALRKDYPTIGGAAAFRTFLSAQVKPFIDQQVRTNGESALMGESLAGLFVIETALGAPAAFNHFIAISPSLWWDKEALSREAPARLAALPQGVQRSLWLSIANEGADMQSGMDRLVAALKAGAPAGFGWRYEPRPGETHGSIYHGAAYEALKASFPKPN